MKKSIMKIVAIIAVLFSIANMVLASNPFVKPEIRLDNEQDFRLERAFVLEQDDGLIAFQTEDGNIWFWESETEIARGNYCIAFDGMGTADKTDDAILTFLRIA